jgi:hypothetical protein
MAFALAILATTSTCSIAQQIYAERKDQDHWFRTLIVPKAQLTVANTERLSRDFLSQVTKSGAQVAVLSIFVSRVDVAIARLENRDNYKQWSVYYGSAVHTPHPTAEAIAINGNVVLRVKDIDGVLTERILAGKNPLRLELNANVFEMLLITLQPAGPLHPCRPTPLMSVYVKTPGPLELHTLEETSREIADLLRSKSTSIYFRNDSWFISFDGFPVIYPFSTDTVPPTEAVYNKSHAFACLLSCRKEGPTCVQVSGM